MSLSMLALVQVSQRVGYIVSVYFKLSLTLCSSVFQTKDLDMKRRGLGENVKL